MLKLPLASVKLLAKIGGYVLDKKNRKIMILILATTSLVIASRTLVNQANRKRLAKESGKLFSRFHSRLSNRFNLQEADDDELLRAAWDLEQYLKARHIVQAPSTARMIAASSKKKYAPAFCRPIDQQYVDYRSEQGRTKIRGGEDLRLAE